jgi:hypothetical protein
MRWAVLVVCFVVAGTLWAYTGEESSVIVTAPPGAAQEHVVQDHFSPLELPPPRVGVTVTTIANPLVVTPLPQAQTALSPTPTTDQDDDEHEKRENHTPRECDQYVGKPLVREWARKGRKICEAPAPPGFPDSAATVVEEYSLDGFHYQPTVQIFRNVVLWPTLGNNVQNPGCSADSTRITVEERGNIGQRVPYWAGPTATWGSFGITPENKDVYPYVVFRTHRFDVHNPFEAFHAYVNAFVTLTVLNISRGVGVQVQFKDTRGRSDMDDAMWRAVVSDWSASGDVPPPLYYEENPGKNSVGIRVHTLIDASSTGTSLLVHHNQHGPLRGPGNPHNCKSAMLRRLVTGVRRSFGAANLQRHDAAPYRIVICARRPYKRADAGHARPNRMFRDDNVVRSEILKRLAPTEGQFTIEVVDFATLTVKEIVTLLATTRVVVGMHGAGLMWTAFLPRHSLLVELFGGDRSTGNFHYHNLAALADLHYGPVNVAGSDVMDPSTFDYDRIANFVRDWAAKKEQASDRNHEP